MPIGRECNRVGEEKLQHSAHPGTLAIDLGSTTTVVAFQAEDANQAQLLELPPISRRPGEVPSLLWRPEQAEPLVGQQVIESGLADRQDPRLATDFKRAIGSDSGNRDAEQAGEQLPSTPTKFRGCNIPPSRDTLARPKCRSARHLN